MEELKMKKMLLGLNKMGKINVVGGAEGEFITNNIVLNTIDLNNTSSIAQVLRLEALFAETTSKWGVVVNREDILLDDGSVVKLKELFSKFKEDNRKVRPKAMDFVEIQNCITDHAVISVGTAKSKSIYKSFKGMVKNIENDIYTVSVGGEIIKLPSICLKRIPKTIMSSKMRDVYEFMINKGRKPLILPEYNYMDISECGKFITYIAEDRLSRFDGAVWNADLRKKFATQKKIRGVLNALFDCSDEEMDTVIMLYGNTNLNVEVIEGKEVKNVFTKELNASSGSLGQSCMLGKPKKYFKVYEDNAKVAVIKDDSGIIVARAVVWNLYSEKLKKRVTFMDRIYTKDDSMTPLMINWAMKQGWYTLKSQSHSQRSMMSPKGESVDFGDFHAKLKSAEYENYPYIDTLYIIVGDRAYASGFIKTAHSTGGSTSRL